MPKVQRKDIPRPLFAHLLLRIQERSIDPMTVCGQGPLVKTFLTPSQIPFGKEL
jgi:hypothetical protein